MTLRSQLYLLQLEEYDLGRFNQWLKDNSNKEVVEKKGKLVWTIKAKIIYFLAKLTGSLVLAVKLYTPVDFLTKKILVMAAKLKLFFLHRKLVVIGITGSWGKTTTKEKVALTLVQKYKVFKTVGNHNTILGVAMDVLKMPFKTEVFVCEMGAYKRGDIKEICELVHPKIGIITVIGPMHLERFKTVEEIKKTKLELFDFVDIKIGPDADWQKPISQYFDVPVIKKFPEVEHRSQEITTNGLTIIDDSYNSNPVGFRMALKKMRGHGHPKILVTPGMIELGDLQFEENEKVAREATKICDQIIVVGETNRGAWQKGSPKAIFVNNIEEAKEKMAQFSKPGAVILLENDLPDHYF